MPHARSEGVGVVVSLSSERQPHRSAADSMECHLIPVEEFEDPTMKQITQFIDICDRARQAKKVCMCVCVCKHINNNNKNNNGR